MPSAPHYAPPALAAWAAAVLENRGVDADKAATVAEVLVEGDLLGHDTHGLALLAPNLAKLADGGLTGRGNVGKGGIVRDAALREKAVADVARWLSAEPGWHVLGHIRSPILGGSGNEEVLLGARHD